MMATLTRSELFDLVSYLQDVVDSEPGNPDVQAWRPTLEKLRAALHAKNPLLSAPIDSGDPRVDSMVVYAWVGEDELDASKGVGLKRHYIASRDLLAPLAHTDLKRLHEVPIVIALQEQASAYGKTIRLIRFTAEAQLMQIDPDI